MRGSTATEPRLLALPQSCWAAQYQAAYALSSGFQPTPSSAAAAVVTVLVLLLIGIPIGAAGAGALAAMVLERWPGPLDDNLVVAPGVALIVWLLV